MRQLSLPKPGKTHALFTEIGGGGYPAAPYEPDDEEGDDGDATDAVTLIVEACRGDNMEP